MGNPNKEIDIDETRPDEEVMEDMAALFRALLGQKPKKGERVILHEDEEGNCRIEVQREGKSPE